MDPQKLSQLDPKLRDAYQRVMGTPVPAPQTTPASPNRGEPIQAQAPPTPPPMPDPTPVPAPQPEPTPTPNPTIEEPSAIPTTPQQPPTPEPQPISTSEPAIPEPQPVIPPQPEPPPASGPTPEPAILPQQPPAQASNFVQMNSEVAAAPSQNFTAPSAMPQAQTLLKKKNGIMLPILFGVVGLIFIVIYTLFWTKIFNFKLPFLP